VRGIDIQKHDIDKVKPSYLRGTVRKGGWWYYYLYAMTVKMPLGTLLLITFAGIGLANAAGKCQLSLGEVLLLTIAVTLIALVSSQTQMNKHMPDVPHISKTISANKFRWEVAEFCWSGSACGRRRGHSPSLCFGKLHEDNSEWRKR